MRNVARNDGTAPMKSFSEVDEDMLKRTDGLMALSPKPWVAI